VKYLAFSLITLALLGCADKTQITIQVSPEIIVIDTEPVQKHDFEKALRFVIGQKIEAGIPRENLIIHLKVDGATKRGELADIEVSMRRLNVKKIVYSPM
jgi:C-terminal processing protease CtpA/Prc